MKEGRMRTRTIVAMTVGLALTSGALALAAEDPSAVYAAQCAKCHGETGKADTPAGKAVKAPALAGDQKVAGMSVADIEAAIKAQDKHKSFVSKLSAEQLQAAATKVKELAGGK
jgi:mono/diheme cytochrome c family protein